MSYAARRRLTLGLAALLSLALLWTAAAQTSKTVVAVGVAALLALGFAAYLVWSAEPHVTFTFAIVLAPLASNWQQLGIPGPLALDRLLIAGGIATVLLGGPAMRDRPRVRFDTVHGVLALAALYAAVSAFFAGTLVERAPALHLVETFGLFPFLVFTLAPIVFPTARERATLLKGLVGLGAYLSVTTLFEMVGLHELVFPRYVVDPSYGIHFGYGRGPFADAVANGFGLYVCAVASLIAVRQWRSPAWRVVALGIALLCLVGTLLTLERSVWIATVVASLVVVLVVRETRRALVPIVLAGGVAVLAALVLVPGLSEKVDTRVASQRSVWDRQNLQHTALHMVEARPLLGFGWGRYAAEDDGYAEQSADYPLTATRETLHSVVLTYAVELGLVGAALWILCLVLGVGGALASRGPPDLKPWRIGLLAVFVFFLVEETFVPPTVFQNLCLWLWAGVVWAGRTAPVEPLASRTVHPSQAPMSLAIGGRDLRPAVLTAGKQLVHTAAAASWRGPDPYDGLLYRWPALMRGGPRRRQAIVQLHARAPVDLRRLYGRRTQPRIAKALGLFGQAALRLDAASPDSRLRAGGVDALMLLVADESAGDAWGYPFDVQTRWSFYPAGAPNVVATAFAADALSEAGRLLGEPRFGERAVRAARWTLERAFNPQTGAFSYHEHSDAVIHNANLLAARLVWGELGAEPAARAAVRQAVARSLAAQAPDGMWAYGEGAGLEWSDSFHTGFVLLALAALRDVDDAVDDALARGAAAYAGRFFGPRGQARLWPGRAFPEDAHAAGTGLSTLMTLHRLGLVEAELVARVTGRVLDSTLVDGHAVWRRWQVGRSRVAYLRWCDAHVALGLADVACGSAPR